MFYSAKAYVNSRGKGKVHVLSHDLKRFLRESKTTNGLLHVVSMHATVAICLLENESELQQELFKKTYLQYKNIENLSVLPRRSRTGDDCYHMMAAEYGLSLTLPVVQSNLAISPFHDVVAFDFEPSEGRREFQVTILGDNPPPAPQGR